jgi:hypothetical protein
VLGSIVVVPRERFTSLPVSDDTKQTELAQELVALPHPRLAPPEIAVAGISRERT